MADANASDVAISRHQLKSVMLKIVTGFLLILLALTTYGWWSTNQPVRTAAKPGKTVQADALTGIDQSTFVLAQKLAAQAESPEEQSLAEAAVRLADHELDLAFTEALRQNEAHPPVLSPDARKIEDRLQRSQKLLDADQASVTRLTAALAQASGAQKRALQDQLDLAASQLELDKDEVAEASQDLLQAGGNQHQRVQMMMQQHDATEHGHANTSAPQVKTAGRAQGLVHQTRDWLALRRKQAWLVYATALVNSDATRLSETRQTLAAQLDASKAVIPELAHHTKSAKSSAEAVSPSVAGAATVSSSTAARSAAGASSATSVNANPSTAVNAAPLTLLATTRQIAADQNVLTLLDQRIIALRQLETTYRDWNTAARAQTLSVLHGILLSVSIVIAIILLLLFVDRWMETLLGRLKLDRRQVETLRSVTRVALQVLGVLIILLIIIGMPSQLGTMIGLAGAGLTVALKDFIVAFIGWLVLMGRNGVRLGDWVEINGVTGEVIELNMFHTVLLETGNWNSAGQPTGRRVTFTNSFAIEKHYFNFSTSGQWLWDELLVLVPYDRDPNLIADAIHKEVVNATAESANQAEEEWRRSAPARRGTVFSATPGFSVRPAVGGIEIAIRYLTRASDRSQLRSKLFQSAVRLLGQPPRLDPRVADTQ